MTDLQTRMVEEPAASPKNINYKDETTSTTEQKDWTIKALPADVVESTRKAARSNGMKINAWVGNALREAAVAQRDRVEPVMEKGHNSLGSLSPERIAKFETGILDQLIELQRKNEELTMTINSMSSILIRLAELKK